MRLDLIEIVLRTEGTFIVDIPDQECTPVLTVGDLYRLVFRKLDLPYQPAPDIEPHVSGRVVSHLCYATFTMLHLDLNPELEPN